jgi:hypothetical protein
VDAGHTGESFAFFAIVCRVLLVFDEGVMEGTQKEGKVVLEAYHGLALQYNRSHNIYLLIVNSFPCLRSLLSSDTKKLIFI